MRAALGIVFRGATARRGTRRLCSASARLEYEGLHDDCIQELRSMGWLDDQGHLVEPPDDERELFISYFNDVVLPLRRTYAWGVPSNDALRCIARHSPHGLVECGAGTGYWSALLAEHGLGVRAFDLTPVHESSSELNGFHALRGHGNADPFYQVEAGGAERAAEHPERSLFLCWPPKESGSGHRDPQVATMAIDALKHYHAAGGQTVAYVGICRAAVEVADGADRPRWDTAGPRFEEALVRDYELVETVALPQWPPARDTLTIWRRAGPPPANGDSAASHVTDEARPGPVHEDENGAPHGLNVASSWFAAQERGHQTRARRELLSRLRSSFDRKWLRSRVVHWLRTGRSDGPGDGVLPPGGAEEQMLARVLWRAPGWLRFATAVAARVAGIALPAAADASR